jgi:hypothetical protein
MEMVKREVQHLSSDPAYAAKAKEQLARAQARK